MYATNRKGTVSLALIVLLVTIQLQCVNLVRANFVPYPTSPASIQILVQSPTKNCTYLSNKVDLIFTLETRNWGSLGSSVDEVICSLDGKTIPSYSLTVYNDWEWDGWLTELSEGKHNVTIKAHATSVYYQWPAPSGSDLFHPPTLSSPVHAYTAVDFYVDAIPPYITILSPQNETYTTADVPLNFTVSDSFEWARYSLDEETNVTVPGNITLEGLPDGAHNLTVYTLDLQGRVSTSETVNFNVTQETEQVNSTQESLPIAFAVAASGISVAAAAVTILIYSKKRRLSR